MPICGPNSTVVLIGPGLVSRRSLYRTAYIPEACAKFGARAMKSLTALALLLMLVVANLARADQETAQPAEVEKALARAGANRAELEKALQTAPSAQRKAMAFL